MAVAQSGAHPTIEAPGFPTDQLERRFWSKVQKGDYRACWPWLGFHDRLGYGQFTFAGKPRRSHRMAYWLACEAWFGPEVKLLHSCDNRTCCNPRHLTPGTQADNMHDRKKREGWKTQTRGDNHHSTKITDQQVADIRENAAGMTQADMARMYGVSGAQICRIVSGKVRPTPYPLSQGDSRNES